MQPRLVVDPIAVHVRVDHRTAVMHEHLNRLAFDRLRVRKHHLIRRPRLHDGEHLPVQEVDVFPVRLHDVGFVDALGLRIRLRVVLAARL